MNRQKLIRGIKYWSQVFLIPVYWFSFLTPRDRKLWLFGSTFGSRFADNPRYLYLYVNSLKDQNIRPVWISHSRDIVRFLNSKNLESYYCHSLRGIYYCLRAKVYLFDNYSKDISFWLSGGAMKVNLWHGVGNKKINADNRFDRVRHPKNFWERFCTYLRRMSDEKPNHYILATSLVMKDIFAGAFGTDNGHVILAGYPRNDALFSQPYALSARTDEEERIAERIADWKREKYRIFFYMPTFRESEREFFHVMDLEAFNRFLEEKRYIFLTKLHPKSRLKDAFSALSYTNMYIVDAMADPYTFMGDTDALVTDYSSVYTDYMLLDKPVVGFFYDYEGYSKNTREGYFNFDEYMPERRARDMESLMEAMESVLTVDGCREKRRVSRERMFLYQDGNSSRRLTGAVKGLIRRGI